MGACMFARLMKLCLKRLEFTVNLQCCWFRFGIDEINKLCSCVEYDNKVCLYEKSIRLTQRNILVESLAGLIKDGLYSQKAFLVDFLCEEIKLGNIRFGTICLS